VLLFIFTVTPEPPTIENVSSSPVHCNVTVPLESLQSEGDKGVASNGERLA